MAAKTQVLPTSGSQERKSCGSPKVSIYTFLVSSWSRDLNLLVGIDKVQVICCEIWHELIWCLVISYKRVRGGSVQWNLFDNPVSTTGPDKNAASDAEFRHTNSNSFRKWVRVRFFLLKIRFFFLVCKRTDVVKYFNFPSTITNESIPPQWFPFCGNYEDPLRIKGMA